mgnify:CR=1 FL=1
MAVGLVPGSSPGVYSTIGGSTGGSSRGILYLVPATVPPAPSRGIHPYNYTTRNRYLPLGYSLQGRVCGITVYRLVYFYSGFLPYYLVEYNPQLYPMDTPST